MLKALDNQSILNTKALSLPYLPDRARLLLTMIADPTKSPNEAKHNCLIVCHIKSAIIKSNNLLTEIKTCHLNYSDVKIMLKYILLNYLRLLYCFNFCVVFNFRIGYKAL